MPSITIPAKSVADARKKAPSYIGDSVITSVILEGVTRVYKVTYRDRKPRRRRKK